MPNSGIYISVKMEWDVLVELSTASLYGEASHSQFVIPVRTISILSVAVRKPMAFLYAVHEIKSIHREKSCLPRSLL